MRTANIGVLSAGVLLALLANLPAGAATTYNYQGLPFNNAIQGTVFTSSDLMTGSAVLNIVTGVAGSGAATSWLLTSTMSGVSAPAASFSISSATPGVAVSFNSFAWDASGNITGWILIGSVNLFGGVANEVLRTCGGGAGTPCNNRPFADIAEVDTNTIFGRNANPAFKGTWTVAVASVPEPATIALVALGLGAVVLRRRRTSDPAGR